MRNIISGADCEYDTSSVVWGEVGSYSVTVTPKENNANALTTTLTVTIEHQFGDPDPATGVARCTHCGKVESNTTFATPVTVNYGAFHGGYTSDSTQDPDGLVKPFGTVAGSTGGNAEVGTYSVGKLRKGMTLSVTGTAQSVGTGEDSWYYPILGIAMREFDPATVGSPYSTGEYASGASVLVRNDGWVLLKTVSATPTAFWRALRAAPGRRTITARSRADRPRPRTIRRGPSRLRRRRKTGPHGTSTPRVRSCIRRTTRRHRTSPSHGSSARITSSSSPTATIRRERASFPISACPIRWATTRSTPCSTASSST